MIQILTTRTCPSLSKRSTLTYQIGFRGEEIFIRLHDNSDHGLFSKEWINVERFGIREGEPISSGAVQSNFKGKSVNTGGFLLAVLLKEGLIQTTGRGYRGCDPETFNLAMQGRKQ